MGKYFLLCMNCGQREKFFKSYWRDVTFDVVDIVDKEGAFLDNESYEQATDIMAENEGNAEYYCKDCDSELVEELEEEDYIDTIWKHTDKEGDWHIDELPEEKRSLKVLQEHLLKKI